MAMQIVYLAWLRERAGLSEEIVEPPASVATVGGLIDWLGERGGGVARALAEPAAVRAAVNLQFARLDTSVSPGDEIAFFPPVTGG